MVRKNTRKRQRGFTLVELIVVIAILGILAALIIPRLQGFTDTAKIAADESLKSLAENTVKTALASGDITADGTITLTDNVWSATGCTLKTGSIYADAPALMAGLVDDADLQYYSTLTITVTVATYDADGALAK